MAVFQGARVRTVALPTHEPARTARVAVPAGARPRSPVRPMGLVMALIVTTTMLGLVYLTQTLGSNATSSEIRGYAAEEAQLNEQIRNRGALIEIETDAAEVIKRAKGLKLKKLGKAVVLDAR